MNILVLNCGSSSLKYRLIELPSETEWAGGEAQRVGPPTAEPAQIVYQSAGLPPQTRQVAMPDHFAAFEQILAVLAEEQCPPPDAIGHRVVHGGGRFQHHTAVDDRVLADLEAVSDLAPLHNPPAIRLIRFCREQYPHLPNVAVFDTVFHSTIPERARTYALPPFLRQELGIRKYGFHGISHQYVATEAARLLGRPLDTLNAVSCHLGSGGASLCAIVNGQSVDNTMGYSPLAGLLMSTRCGDLDPAVALHLLALHGGNPQAVEKLLNRKSGVLGLSGFSADIRDSLSGNSAPTGSNANPDETVQVYLWRLRKYFGAYLATVGRPDAVIFTDTIGETIPRVRQTMCTDMEAFGIQFDEERNEHLDRFPADIAIPESPVRVLVIRTNEELAIARDTAAVLCDAPAPVEEEVRV
jgi:acetate kinase